MQNLRTRGVYAQQRKQDVPHLQMIRLNKFEMPSSGAPRDVDDLKTRITEALATIDNAMLGRVWQEMDYRLDVFHVTHSVHIKHL